MRSYRLAHQLVLLGYFFLPVPAHAQQICQFLLQNGIFDTNATSQETFSSDYFRSIYCDRGSNSSTSGISIGIPNGEIPLDFGASSANSSSHNVCDDRTSSSEDWKNFRNWSSRASPVIAKTFNDCINSEGTHIWTTRSTVANVFSLHVRVHYGTRDYPATKMQFSFTPSEMVSTCSPTTKSELEAGIYVENLDTFKVDCEMASHTKGVEIGLRANREIPYGNMSIRPYHPSPIFALSTTSSARDGVKIPNPADATYPWGSDTLSDRYDGQVHVPATSHRSWAEWNFDNLTPGQYQVFVTYASAESRPLFLFVNGNLALSDVASEPTGSPPDGWRVESRQQRAAGKIRIDTPSIVLRLEATNTDYAWPHFKELRLVFIGE